VRFPAGLDVRRLTASNVLRVQGTNIEWRPPPTDMVVSLPPNARMVSIIFRQRVATWCTFILYFLACWADAYGRDHIDASCERQALACGTSEDTLGICSFVE
jgi:hypothetical protein